MYVREVSLAVIVAYGYLLDVCRTGLRIDRRREEPRGGRSPEEGGPESEDRMEEENVK